MGIFDRVREPFEDDDRSLQYERVQQKRISASQVYEDIKKAVKIVFYLLCLLALLFGIYKIFSFWFFAGLVASALPIGWLVVSITRVQRTILLAMHISDSPEDRDYMGLYSIPNKMLEEFKRTGSDFHYLTTYEGTNIAICDDIDFENWTIKTPWFSEVSNLEFFRSKQAFIKLKEMYVEELRENGSERSLRSALVYKRVIEELQKHYTKFDQVMLEPGTEEDQDKDKQVVEDAKRPVPKSALEAMGIDVLGAIDSGLSF